MWKMWVNIVVVCCLVVKVSSIVVLIRISWILKLIFRVFVWVYVMVVLRCVSSVDKLRLKLVVGWDWDIEFFVRRI